MWVSQCSYISKLIHPSKFASAMDEMIQSAAEKFGDELKSGRPQHNGLGRYSSEHWVASHPDR